MSAEAIAKVAADLRDGRIRYMPLSAGMKAAAVAHMEMATKTVDGQVAGGASKMAPIIDCTAVYQTLAKEEGKAYNYYDDFPCVAPPWPTALFCYVNEPGNVVVMFAVAVERQGDDPLFAETAATFDAMSDDPGRPWKPGKPVDWARVRWTLETFIWVGGHSSTLGAMPTHGPLLLWRWAIYEDGTPADMHWMQLSSLLPVEEWDMASLVLMSALNLLNCQNVDIVDYEPTSRHERRRLERMGTHTSTIHVFPAGKRRRPGARGEPYGVAHHGVRGHFATYGMNGRGLLFGKYAGRFYVPPHVRGRREHGEVEQDYELHPEQR